MEVYVMLLVKRVCAHSLALFPGSPHPVLESLRTRLPIWPHFIGEDCSSEYIAARIAISHCQRTSSQRASTVSSSCAPLLTLWKKAAPVSTMDSSQV